MVMFKFSIPIRNGFLWNRGKIVEFLFSCMKKKKNRVLGKHKNWKLSLACLLIGLQVLLDWIVCVCVCVPGGRVGDHMAQLDGSELMITSRERLVTRFVQIYMECEFLCLVTLWIS